MMSAVQPYISGAISKTVNMPGDVTAEDIARSYIEAWRLGLKAIAIYRDGCKRTQPLNTSMDQVTGLVPKKAVRRRLPDERAAVTHKFSIGGHEGYITVGLYPEGNPGEIFITMSKEGSTISGLMDAFATSISMALQYGVPLRILVEKFSHMRFEPSGFTGNREIPIAKSILDYIFRWLGHRFLPPEEVAHAAEEPATELVSSKPAPPETQAAATRREIHEHEVYQAQADAPPCHACGSIMVRSGACYKCVNCGETSGCS
jgi:ribonucleoside-diphosphate reductase alpha chain